MSEIIEWARHNCEISLDNEVIIVGRYYNKAFRIFLQEQRAGIAKVDEDTGKVISWLNVVWAHDLQQFKTYLHCN